MRELIMVAMVSEVMTVTGAAWQTCGGLAPALDRTACPADRATCCMQKWMPVDGNWGCCALPNAVCCSNGYTCCPAGTACVDEGSASATRTTCVPEAGVKAGGNVTGEQVCKFADPGKAIKLDKTKKLVLVMGDSVSIGYTPALASQLADVAHVTHSPYPTDGGVEETKYGARCIDYLLRAPSGTPIEPDLIVFNWGLHNALSGNKTGTKYIDGNYGPPTEYAPYLKPIMERVRKAAPKVLFALTTPDLCNADIDQIVVTLNQQAISIAKDAGVPILDLYAPIVKKCGPVPTASCFGMQGCYCPHCNADGYAWIAQSALAPAIRSLLDNETVDIVV
eukprot:TRINITY_DN10141_c0_g1_i1.p1 TRINITY_DN10141_c0_g1~~TRINITY_DN10141_c0_g1_i1.p1  ORF type:complete len:354 (-),score=45.45 TRINITY_DN10141_c0_g1_i1:186-1193(-)